LLPMLPQLSLCASWASLEPATSIICKRIILLTTNAWILISSQNW
jgi:hypothetical protein